MLGRHLAALLLVAGCGDDGASPDSDASIGIVDGGENRPAAPAPPATPAPPELGPCPDGWRESTDGDVTVCDPQPEPGFSDCTGGQAHFPGESGCAPIGAACPSGAFAADLPADTTVVYVLEGSTGDGSMASPFGTINDGIGAARAGDVVALGSGTYDGEVRMRAGVTLWGACVDRTTLTESAGTAMYVVQAGGRDSALRDLRLADSDARGLFVSRPEASLRLDGVLVENVREIGVTAVGAMTGRELVVRDVEGRRGDLVRGWGVDVEIGGTIELERAAVERARGHGVIASMGGSIMLRDSVVRDTRSDSGLRQGRGVVSQFGSSAVLERVLVRGNREQGLVSGLDGSTMSADHVVVRDTLADELSREFGRALTVTEGASFDGRRLLFEDNTEHGLVVTEVGSAATVADLVLRRVAPGRDGAAGLGVGIFGGADLTMTRAVVEDTRQGGIVPADAGTSFSGTDLVVRRVSAEAATMIHGRGINVQNGAVAEVTRALIEDNRHIHVHASGPGTRLIATDVVGRRSDLGRGLNLELIEHAEVTRAVFEEVYDHGVFAAGDFDVVLSDVVIREVHGTVGRGRFAGWFGRGINVQELARLRLDRAVVERARDVGIGVFYGGTLIATDVDVRGTLPRDCASTTCTDAPAGVGAGAYGEGALVTLARFAVDEASLCGIHLALGGVVDATEGEVSNCQVGACLQTEGFDPARVSDGVAYRSNGTNLQATMLPVPDSAQLTMTPTP